MTPDSKTDEDGSHNETAVAPEERPPADATTAEVVFHPQIWHNKRALTSDDLERFEVPIEDATDEKGRLYPDDSQATDSLRDHPNAPERARKWQGPFYVTIKSVY